jgi:uncharacterized protein YozE (UPF0346 family)
MTGWLKSKLSKLVLTLAAAGTLTGAGSYGCDPNVFISEGDKVKYEVNGVISAEEEQEIVDLINEEKLELIISKDDESNCKGKDIYEVKPQGVMEFKGPVQQLVNDVEKMFVKEFSDKGFDKRTIDDKLHIYMPKDMEEYTKKFKEVTLSNSPSYSAAFYAGNNTMYIPKTYELPFFYSIFFHEFGHHLRHGAWEYSAMANEVYASLKLYNLNKKLGSVVVDQALRYFPPGKAGEFEFGFEDYYALGCFSLIAMSNLHDGSLEEGWNYTMHTPQLHLEQKVWEIANQYEDLRTAYLNEFEKLLETDGFRNSFDKLNDEEFNEFSDYLRLNVNYLTTIADFDERWEKRDRAMELVRSNFSGEEMNSLIDKIFNESQPEVNDDLRDKLVNLGERFLTEHNNNPYFNTQAKLFLSYHYSSEIKLVNIQKMLEGQAMEETEEIYRLAKRVIDLNEEYPCKYELLKCPRELTKPRPEQVAAYNYILGDYKRHINKHDADELLGLGIDFVNKFYPDKNFAFLENSWPLDVNGPYINLSTAYLLEFMARQSETANEYEHYCEMAKEWSNYVKQGSCEVIKDEKIKTCCHGHLPNWLYQRAEEVLEGLGDCSRYKK